MTELENGPNFHYKTSRPKPNITIVWTLAASLIGFHVVGPFAMLFLYLPFYPGDLQSLLMAMQDLANHPELKMFLFMMQAAGACIGLILLPLLIRRWSQAEEKILGQPFYIAPFILVIIIGFAFMGLNSVFIEWNQQFKFPEALGGLEEFMRSMEDDLGEASKILTTFDSTFQVAVAFFVIAVLAPIGEELVYRGIVQTELFRGTKNIHLSIWIAAAIFSAIHLQFYGFVPRLFLGALFGYLYYWSGNLILSMIAHAVNNGFIIITLYLHQQKLIDIDIESPESAPWQAVLFSALITALLLYAFRKFYQQKNLTTPA
jgi:uncharacterized protein